MPLEHTRAQSASVPITLSPGSVAPCLRPARAAIKSETLHGHTPRSTLQTRVLVHTVASHPAKCAGWRSVFHDQVLLCSPGGHLREASVDSISSQLPRPRVTELSSDRPIQGTAEGTLTSQNVLCPCRACRAISASQRGPPSHILTSTPYCLRPRFANRRLRVRAPGGSRNVRIRDMNQSAVGGRSAPRRRQRIPTAA